MTKASSRLARFLAVAAVAALVAACAKPLRKDQSALAKPTTPDGGVLAGQSEPNVRDQVMTRSADLADIYFSFDSSHLSETARAALKRNAEWLKAHPSDRVQVAGYCDARGTVEYNLALGQRRAAAVRDYYAGLGVERARIATISYGKERPTCGESSEACWSRERHAETLLAVSADVSRGPLPTPGQR